MKKYMILFFLIIFVIGTDTFLISPLLPTLREMYGISTSISGWMVSAYALGYFLFALISGPISDRLDKKKVLVWGFLAFGISTLLCGFATNFYLMLLFRFAAGVSASFASPQIWASIPIIIPKKDIVRVMGYTSAALSISQIIGVPISSYLAAISWKTPFFVISAASLILVLITKLIMPSIHSGENSKKKPSLSSIYSGVFTNKQALSYLVAYFTFQTGNFCVLNFIGSWFTKSFALSLSGIGTAMVAIGIGNLIGTTFGSKLIHKIGIPKSLLLGLCILLGIYIVLPFANSLNLAVIGLTLVMLTNGFIFPIFMTTLQSTTTTARSTISSLTNAAMYAGSSLGGIIGGIVISKFTGFFGIAYFAILMYLITLFIYNKSGIFTKQLNKNLQQN
ncbi:MFS transporter [Microbacteriaceae bacterium 4G12]